MEIGCNMELHILQKVRWNVQPISPPIPVRTNAEQFGKEYDDELHRVIIHGILHLCGINDKGPGEREIMEAEENKALALLKEMKSKKEI